MDLRVIEVMRGARVPLAMNCRKGDRVVVLTDIDTEPLVWQAMAAAALEVGGQPIVVIMLPLPFHHSNPPATVAGSLRNADLVVNVTSKGIAHSSIIEEIGKAGIRVVSCEEVTADMLRSGAATADYEEMEKLGKRVLEKWNHGSRVRVTSEPGTDLSASIQGRHGWMVAGRCAPLAEGSPIQRCAFPDGEAAVAPLEGTAEGTVVWDLTMTYIGTIREPIKGVFEKGRLVSVGEGQDANRLSQYLKEYGDEGAYNLAEIAIGLNPGVIPTGTVRTDKKLYGSVHIALGMNTDTGWGKNVSRLHVDGVIRKPTVYIDGQVVVEAGVIKV
jgi:2,5-dihydroxypyridine 5,6-dioxygenase